MIKICRLLLVLVQLTCALTKPAYKRCTELPFLPMPKTITCNLQQENHELENPCDIFYIIESESKNDMAHFEQLLLSQQYKTFKCKTIHAKFKNNIKRENINIEKDKDQIEELKNFPIVVRARIMDSRLKSAFLVEEEEYHLIVYANEVLIEARHYVGFVRGLETFMQSITCNKHSSRCYIAFLPIQIYDQPLFPYRGVLVDTSRHFLPIHILQQTIDAMMYNKLNVLHWHIVDQDSFPLELDSHPELAQHASFSIYERYSTEDVRNLVRYAMVRGVRIVPEIDTPGHAASWARAKENEEVGCTFSNNMFKGPLDVTMHKTYELIKDVFKEIFQLFPDPYVHLGGDQVFLTCLKNKTEFLQKQNITASQIQSHYRKKQKNILQSLSPTKKFIYWMTQQSIEPQADDIVHWWGYKQLVPPVRGKVIVSQSRSQFYVDMGAGKTNGDSYYNYATWWDMYNINLGKEIKRFPNSQEVIGAVVTLWGEVSNQYTHHAKLWIRSSSVAERAWTSQQHKSKPDFFRRLTTHQRLMNRRGIPTAPATCQQCQINPQFC